MNFYQQINPLFPYLFSIRKLEGYLCIDVEFPNTWKLPKKYIDEKQVMEQPSSKENIRLISFISEFQNENINKMFENIKAIINWNLEREEKDSLFNAKVQELKSFFEKQNLDNLKNLEFQIKKTMKIELEEEISSDED